MTSEQINQLGTYAALGILAILLIAVIAAAVYAVTGSRRSKIYRANHMRVDDLVSPNSALRHSDHVRITAANVMTGDAAMGSLAHSDESIMASGDAFAPAVNIDGTPMIVGTSIDVNGNPYGTVG